jgi:UDP-N-acetylmuramyl pentapeptide phosphotransferase/UDP-N-acetylglucosamine-1-phosphate transferase
MELSFFFMRDLRELDSSPTPAAFGVEIFSTILFSFSLLRFKDSTRSLVYLFLLKLFLGSLLENLSFSK